jgi:hemoglobin-like flavoprotein
MNDQTKKLVRESFEEIRDLAGPLALLFYGRLFEMDPSIRPLFRGDMKAQGAKLMAMLEAVVGSLDDFDSICPQLEELGRKHVEYGVSLSHYDTLTSALLWALAQALQPAFYQTHRAAWREVIESINSAMKAGARSATSRMQ